MGNPVSMSNDLSRLRVAISRRLLRWAVLNMGLGAVALAVQRGPLLQGLATQSVAWGAVNAVIALAGFWSERRRLARGDTAGPEQGVAREGRALRRLLLLNTGLDVLYIAAGVAAAVFRGATSSLWRGHGLGIILQGAFLFFFDLIHAQAVPSGVPLQPWEAFRGPEHLPFLLEGGRPAALLVHGFPGTPAEMRALGQSLHRAGWTVQGLLLPGFGPALPTVGQCRYEDWLSAIESALHELRQGHAPLLLVGYSMGGALSTTVAARAGVDGLILLAPFVWADPPLQRAFGWLLRPLLPRYFRPFRLFNLSDPQARRFLVNLMPHLDLDDSRVRDELRQVQIPLSLLEQVRKAGQLAIQSAPWLGAPILVCVGTQDQLAGPARVQPLLQRIRPPPTYLQFDVGHDLTNTDGVHWPLLEKAVIEFAQSLSS